MTLVIQQAPASSSAQQATQNPTHVVLCMHMMSFSVAPFQVSAQVKNKGAKGWLLYDSGDAAGATQQPNAAGDAELDTAGAAGAERTPGLAQWLLKLVPVLTLGLLHQLGCQSLDQLLLLPGVFDSLLLIMPSDKEGLPNNM
jgi:hypothetical protein